MCSLCGLLPDVGPVIRHASSFFWCRLPDDPDRGPDPFRFRFRGGKKVKPADKVAPGLRNLFHIVAESRRFSSASSHISPPVQHDCALNFALVPWLTPGILF